MRQPQEFGATKIREALMRSNLWNEFVLFDTVQAAQVVCEISGKTVEQKRITDALAIMARAGELNVTTTGHYRRNSARFWLTQPWRTRSDAVIGILSDWQQVEARYVAE